MSDDREHDVDELGGELRERIDEQLERRPPRPDVAAVLARAQELDPSVADAFDTPPEDTGVFGTVDIADERQDREAMRVFVNALVEQLDEDLEERRLHPIPEVPRPPRRVVPWMVGGLAAAAAVLVMVLGMQNLDAIGNTGEATTGGEQAAFEHERDEGPTGSAIARTPEPRVMQAQRPQSSRPADPVQAHAEQLPEPVPLIEVFAVLTFINERIEDQQLRPKAPQRRAESSGRRPPASADRAPTRDEPSIDERIATLDAEAQALWREGKLAAAEDKFREITRIGGLRRSVELAYGEMFALVRQQKRDQQPVWREYLQRFPRGRYAEDAQAGLCRRATGAERERCWQQYREKFPGGMHAPEDSTPK